MNEKKNKKCVSFWFFVGFLQGGVYFPGAHSGARNTPPTHHGSKASARVQARILPTNQGGRGGARKISAVVCSAIWYM